MQVAMLHDLFVERTHPPDRASFLEQEVWRGNGSEDQRRGDYPHVQK